MPKKVKVIVDHNEAERQMLGRSLQKTPEERLIWLIRQNELMSRMNSVKKKSLGYEILRKNG